MKLDLPDPHTRIRSGAHQPPLPARPEHGVDTSRPRVHDRDVLERPLDAPDVDVHVQRARGAVLRVGRPGEAVHPCAVGGPV
jgi:hypothetical protein